MKVLEGQILLLQDSDDGSSYVGPLSDDKILNLISTEYIVKILLITVDEGTFRDVTDDLALEYMRHTDFDPEYPENLPQWVRASKDFVAFSEELRDEQLAQEAHDYELELRWRNR